MATAVSDFANFEVLFSMVIARSVESLVSSAGLAPVSANQSELDRLAVPSRY
jgi:hypothetical protein